MLETGCWRLDAGDWMLETGQHCFTIVLYCAHVADTASLCDHLRLLEHGFSIWLATTRLAWLTWLHATAGCH
jgi:hypothetical protein